MSLEEKMKMEPEDWDEFEEWVEKKKKKMQKKKEN